MLADHQAGDLIAWSGLSATSHSRDLSVTRTAQILDLAGLLNDDRISSFAALRRARLQLLPSPMAPMSSTGCSPAARADLAAGPATNTPSA
ncbi:hypothetical protein [Acrocarpospora sp. B8E8]|uniref:hypothetical protein n=1 Tax=Acrocarpospora sp. B8E8 TaxID=3153572 RepID=UPI00325E1911